MPKPPHPQQRHRAALAVMNRGLGYGRALARADRSPGSPGAKRHLELARVRLDLACLRLAAIDAQR